MESDISIECITLIKRLKNCKVEELIKNPTSVLKFYPVRNPDNENTVFDEVYPLVNEDLLKKTYKFKIFFFLNIFLSSTKVPAHVIAAYLKRLSRLSLEAKPRSLVAILRLTNNLLSRHPMLISLRNRVDDKAREMEHYKQSCTLRDWLDMDPFDQNQTRNLKETKAMDSCLWELMPLRFHEHGKIVKEAQFLSEKDVPDVERDLDDLIMTDETKG